MRKITMAEAEKIAEEYGLKPSVVKGTDVVNIRKKPTENLEDISWKRFDQILKDRGLAVYKAPNDWLKIMKDR